MRRVGSGLGGSFSGSDSCSGVTGTDATEVRRLFLDTPAFRRVEARRFSGAAIGRSATQVWTVVARAASICQARDSNVWRNYEGQVVKPGIPADVTSCCAQRRLDHPIC